MKFALAWSELANQNLTLKVALSSVSVCALVFALLSAKLSLKEPLIVERGCFSTVAKQGNSQRTNDEIEAFVKIALSQRFDTDVKQLRGYLSASEISSRSQEQKELSSRQLSQKVVVNSVKIDGSSASVDATRIITVGAIRSALPLSLSVKVESQDRDDGNPYGLLLSSVKLVEQKEVK
jgi:hypothetical protein